MNRVTFNDLTNVSLLRRYLKMFSLFALWILLVGTVLSDWPDWEDGKRTLKVYIGTGGTFQTNVNNAIAAWNTANAGNKWNLVVTTTQADADVVIQTGNPGAGNTGVATPTIQSTGLFGWGSGEITKVDITIDPGLTSAQSFNAIMHELGHCMRLAHTGGASDIMKTTNDPAVTTPSATDISEAKVSDEDPPCPLEAAKYLIADHSETVTLTPKPGSGITLDGLTGVSIMPLTGNNFTVYCEQTTWDATSIYAMIYPHADADHNEVFRIYLDYPAGTQEYTGVLTITPDAAPAGKYPHAMAGPDITVEVGTPVVLDGRESYHDDPNVLFYSTWLTTAGLGILGNYGELTLPEGDYTAVIQTKDYYSFASYDTTKIKVEAATNVEETHNKEIPQGYILEQNYPNPFNATTNIVYSIPVEERVQIYIYDITGRKIETLLDGYRSAGQYNVMWNSADLASGVYIYELRAGAFVKSKKMVITK